MKIHRAKRKREREQKRERTEKREKPRKVKAMLRQRVRDQASALCLLCWGISLPYGTFGWFALLLCCSCP